MEKRKDSLSSLKLCRFCLSQDGPLSMLYDRTRMQKKSVTLPLKILSSVSIEVFPSDKMPHFICNRCKLFMDLCYEYKQICRQADETILQHIQNGTALEPVEWPSTLVKVFRYAAKNIQDLEVVKTVIEDGATVQVTSQEITDSEEEDDDNVYNIKIGDGSDEGSKSGTACIKVVTSTDKLEITKEKPKQAHKGFATVSKLMRHVRTHAGERAYPCKYCNKSFMKSHHYTRHLRLKHRETIRTSRGPFGETDQYRCEQCEDSFATQDEVIYHSAIHATQNLICPLCQEKFENVDAVTAHIKSHVNGMEFMCDLCELVFTSKEKLDNHITIAHEDEIRHEQELGLDESSMEVDADDDDDDDNEMNVKEEDDHMVVEIKKADNFMISNLQGDSEEKINNTNSEESESETTYAELSTVDTLAIIKKDTSIKEAQEKTQTKLAAAVTAVNSAPDAPKSDDKNNESATAHILRKAEEIKRKVVQQQTTEPSSDKKEKSKVENSNNVGANDKSLRLLEKELQELKRTNSRCEVGKTPGKSVETLRTRRPQLHTSTPKARAIEEKKSQLLTKSPALEKKLPERRTVTKENKEPKEVKEAKCNNNSIKEDKEKDTPKTVIKNGANDKSNTDEGVRRSTRPSKIKDYAKMIRERSQVDDDDDEDDSDDADDEEYKEEEKIPESRSKPRRSSVKPPPKPVQTPPAGAPPPRKRGRPRKEPPKVPAKVKKNEEKEEEEETKADRTKTNDTPKKTEQHYTTAQKADNENKTSVDNSSADTSKQTSPEQKLPAGGLLVSPTGQTLKKVPIKALPPGVKPLPLPVNARPVGAGELCEMQIGKKVVKVQKIVMTKAEVEAMAKKGLVEMKDGTMVLKQGIKIPTADPQAIKSTLVGEGEVCKESPSKKEKATPTRCDFGEDV